jgi:serine/threonine-protein kinase
MPDLREVELRIAVAEGLLSRPEAELLGEEARRKQLSPLALLVEQGRVSEESYQSLFAAALNDPAWRAGGQEGSASTYTMTAPPPSADQPPFPVASWDRYSNVRFLGQGGMGKVYLAVDTRLRREVAIKFVRGDDAEHVRRLIAEARTQARVNHERICKVYEVDEVEGKVYIAMQYIHGKPLGRCAGELTLEQKVMLVRGAAEGIHEAHRVGIIHRDIKPSNIMVERSDDGEIRPYVMDFGLAHSAQEAGATQTGTVLGTPRYMAPEQARGSAAQLDRRADVYSLGATLYHLLTGEPAVPGETIAEVIHNLITVEPRPLREIDRNIPLDLEAIVLHCLEKERSARYDSARALADDLGRFLDGEPVVARPAGAWYRLRKRIAKHRRLVAAGAAVLVVLGIAIGSAIKTSREAAERERLARRFTEQVEQIEAIARYSALSPLHDLAADRKAITARMDALRAEIAQAGDVAAGPGHYALGRGYLALDDDDRARGELEGAWAAGPRESRVAYALAIVMGHLYQKALRAADRIEDADQRAAKRRDIERNRGDVLGYLEASLSEGVAPEGVAPEFVAALIAFYERKFDIALKHLDAIVSRRPWNYELPELRGDILLARGTQRRDHGDRENAAYDFDESRKAYTAAAEVGRSVPAIYKSLGDLEYAVLAAKLYQQDAKPQAERALAATRNALTAMPDHADAMLLAAMVRRTQAEQKATLESNRGDDVEALLKQALDDAQHAARLAPGRPEALLEMAKVQWQWGSFQVSGHDDPSAHFAEAIAISDRIQRRDRDAIYWGNRGLIYSTWADAEDQLGGASDDTRHKAIEAFDHALQLDHQLLSVWIDVGVDWYKRGSRPGAKDPEGDLRKGLAALDTAKAINRDHLVPYFYAGKIYSTMARRTRSHGGDPGPELVSALEEYRKGLAIGPKVPQLHNGIGGVLMQQAGLAWERGRDPGPWLDDAEAAFRKAITVSPNQGHGYNNMGEVHIQRAWLRRARGEDPGESVVHAIDELHAAIARTPKDTLFLTNLAMAHAILAGYDLEHGRDPTRSLKAGREAIDKAIASNPQDAQARIYLAELRGLDVRFRARDGHGIPDEFADVARAFATATAIAPDDQDYWIVAGEFCRAWANLLRDRGRDPSGALNKGFEFVSHVLDQRPTWPDALILRAGLALIQAQVTTGAAQQAAAARAAKDFAAATSTNHALGKVWAGQAALAQQLAGSR